MDKEYEYFELKYLEDINSLFLKIKQKSDYYNLNLFNENKNFMDLFDFIYQYLEYNISSSDDEDENEEDYLNYNIDAEKN